jgi:hypothetical protein
MFEIIGYLVVGLFALRFLMWITAQLFFAQLTSTLNKEVEAREKAKSLGL